MSDSQKAPRAGAKKIVRASRGFTLVELLVVIGIIAVLIGVLLPALSKARQQSRTTVCLSNLRSMGQAFHIYLSENKGHLPYYLWNTPSDPNLAWNGYWIGLLSNVKAQTGSMLCPETEAVSFNTKGSGNGGFGLAKEAWSGQYQSANTGVLFAKPAAFVNTTNVGQPGGYRIGSYGFNRYMSTGTSSKYFGASITAVKPSTNVPLFFDSVWIDGLVNNFGSGGNATNPVQVSTPANLSGLSAPQGTSADDHWRFLIKRHGRAINVCFADGSAHTVNLEDTYQMNWHKNWVPYTLQNLPRD